MPYREFLAEYQSRDFHANIDAHPHSPSYRQQGWNKAHPQPPALLPSLDIYQS